MHHSMLPAASEIIFVDTEALPTSVEAFFME